MSSNAPWSVKGIDPKAREIAKDLARRSGKTLGEWLNEVIIEGEGGDADPAKVAKGAAARAEPREEPRDEFGEDDRGPYREVLRDLSRQAARETAGSREAYRDLSAYEDLERARPARDDRYAEPRRGRPTASLYPEPPRRSRFDDDYSGEDELSRVTRALDRLSSRIEAAENRSTVAISGIDQSVVGVLSRLDEVERDNTSIAARFEGVTEELRQGQRQTHDRLRALEEDDQGPRQAEAMRSLEAALGKIAGQLYEGDQRTQAAIGEIRQGVREELTQAEYRTRAAVGELREEINDSEQRARAAFGVLREELTDREHRTQSSLESLHQVVTQTDQAAREQVAAVREDVASLSARVERTEMRQQASPLLPPRPADPGIVVDQVLAKVTQRLEQAESKTSEALRSLQSSFAGLDQRLRLAETAAAPDSVDDGRFENLASDLTHAVEQARFDMAEQLSATAETLGRSIEQARAEMAQQATATADGSRFEELERAVRELTSHVETAERRSSDAIERMGREVARVTDAMTARMSGVEADAVQVVERVSAVVEKRLGRADAVQAEALDRLGDEMGRISERLAERVDISERRSADAIEEVGDRVAGVAERLNERFERTAETLTERIRQSDERAQRLHDEARERLEQRLGAAERGLTERVEARLAETQRGLVERVEQRVGDVHRGLVDKVDKVEQRVGDVHRGLSDKVEQRAAELQRGLTDRVEQRVGEVQRGLADTVEQRFGETRGWVDTVQQRVGEVQRGLADSFEHRFGETQRSLAEVASRVDRAQTMPPEAPVRDDYAATVMAPPISFLDDDPELAPFGSVEASSPPALDEFDPSEVFRRTPLEPDVFVEPPLALEPAPEPEPVAAAAPPPELDEAVFEPADDVFEPVYTAAAPEPFADIEPEPTPEPEVRFESKPEVAPALVATPPSISSDLDPFEDAFDAADEFVAKPSAAAPAPVSAAPPAAAPAAAAKPAVADLPPPPVKAEPASPRSSTRDMLEQARAAAKKAMAEPAKGKTKLAPLPSVTPASMRDLGPPPPMAGLKNSGLKGPGLGSLLSNLRKGKKDEREGSMRTFALVAGTSFAVGLTGAGYALLQRNDDAAEPGAADGRLDSPTVAAGQTPLAASLTVESEPSRPSAAAARGDATTALYAGAVRLIEGGDTTRGLADLRRAADGGHAPAQFYLAKLYENGEGGLPRDAAQARSWTERAAQGGDRKAMHNLALFYFSGDGGAKNMTTAAQWFRRAADAGLVDSQYNLGRLYEEGFGVSTNAAEAYKWYLIAGRAGDSEARTSAERIKRSLSAEAQAAAQRSALAFRSPTAAPVATAQAAGDMGASEVAAAQRALQRLGYYRGPSDGVASPALSRAIAAWQREQGLTATGTVGGDTLARLAAAAG